MTASKLLCVDISKTPNSKKINETFIGITICVYCLLSSWSLECIEYYQYGDHDKFQ